MQSLIVTNFGVVLLVASVFFSAFLYKANLLKRRLVAHFINLLTVYILIVAAVLLFDLYLTWKLNTFDLDGNGMFTADESTKEQFFYQNLVINDLGRNFSFVWALLVSPLVSLTGFCLNWVFKKLTNNPE